MTTVPPKPTSHTSPTSVATQADKESADVSQPSHALKHEQLDTSSTVLATSSGKTMAKRKQIGNHSTMPDSEAEESDELHEFPK